MNRISAEFLVRPGCHLCEEVEARVLRAARWSGAALAVVDIDRDDRLVRDFGLRIPVVRVGDEVVAEGRIGGVRLWRVLLRHRLGPRADRGRSA